MKVLGNKFFIIGGLFLLLVSIPLTIYFVKQQQDLRSKAAPTSTIFFRPTTISDVDVAVGEEFTVDVMINPGQNVITAVAISATYDQTILEATDIQPSETFSLISAKKMIPGKATLQVGISSGTAGFDPSKTVQTATKVATITFKALKPTGPTATEINMDPNYLRASSIGKSDADLENVLMSTTVSPVKVLIGAGVEPTPTGELTPTPTEPDDNDDDTTPTPTDEPQATNKAPACTELSISPSNSGAAPFSVTLQGKGSDTDGAITKAIFNFGDGQTEDITDGLNQGSVSVQSTHIYQNTGSFSTTLVFTDDENAISASCTQTISVINPTPTIDQPGDLRTTLGIIGGAALTILGGIILLAL